MNATPKIESSVTLAPLPVLTAENPMHPQKQLLTREQFAALDPTKHLIQRKYDGEFATRQIGDVVLLGEWVRPKSGGLFTASDRALFNRDGTGDSPFFAAFTVAEIGGQDYLRAPTRVRHALLNAISIWPPGMIIAETVTDVAAVIAAGGEGACAHDWDTPWAGLAGAPPMLVHKQGGIWLCKVTATGGTQSVEIADAETNEPRGKVALRGGKCDQVRTGSLIRIEGMGLTESGKIREPQPCREWLVQY